MQLLRRLSFTMLLLSMMTLVACGDGDGDLTGGGDGDGGGGDTPVETVLTITKSDGELSADNDITVIANVVNDGSPVADKTVTFSLAVPGMATLDPISGTATTDTSGNASIVVKVADIQGSVNVIATYEDASENISFNSLGDGIKIVEGEPVPDAITLFANQLHLASSGVEMIELTAIAKDANNHLLSGVTINFEVDSGTIGGIENADGEITDVTDINGQVKKGLITFANPENRTITVNVSNGDVTDSLEVEVVGTTVTLTGSNSLAINDEATYIIKLLDSDGNGIANTTVALSLSGESTETPTGSVADITIPNEVTTDFNGQATVSVVGTSGGTNTIVATGLGATASKDVSVQADSFIFTSFSNGVDTVNPTSALVPDVLLSQTASMTLTWLRSGAPVADGTVVNFTTTRGDLSSTTATTVDGKVTTTLTSTNAGKSLVTFTGTDTVDSKEVELSNQLEFEFVADTASRLIAQASPKSIAPNGQSSTISVVVRDADGNLVKGKDIDFKLDDVSSGSIFPASARTDSNGSASTVYTSNTTSTENGINITATVRGSSPVVSDQVTLTVADREMFIRLGTGNTIESVDDTTYNMPYSVFVSDIDSTPIEGLTLTVSAIPKDYHKGYWVVVLKDGEFDHYAPLYTETCFNEDGSNGGVVDGILDTGEDVNSNGKLTPGNIVNVVGEVTTDAQGRAVIDIIYGEVFGGWADIDLIVSAKVNGSESFAHEVVRLTYSGEDVTDEGNPPAAFIWPNSPFGAAADCTDAN